MFNLNFFHYEVKFQGLTGEVQFNLVTGERRVHNGLDILNVVEHNVKKVCTRRFVNKNRHFRYRHMTLPTIEIN